MLSGNGREKIVVGAAIQLESGTGSSFKEGTHGFGIDVGEKARAIMADQLSLRGGVLDRILRARISHQLLTNVCHFYLGYYIREVVVRMNLCR